MIKKLIIIFLLASNTSFAQYLRPNTKFDSFIIQPGIEWAGYVNTWLDVEKVNFNKLLFSRFLKNQIKVSIPGEGGPSDITLDSLNHQVLYPQNCLPLLDSLGNEVVFTTEIKPYEIDTTALTSTDIYQVLYIENGVLKSYVLFVTPIMVNIKVGQTKAFLGYAQYFSTCYNYKFNYQPKSKNKDLYLGETTKVLRTDTIDWSYRPIKELYRRNLLETLLPYVWDNKLDVYTLDSKVKLEPLQISDSILARVNPFPEQEYYSDPSGVLNPNKYLGHNFNLEDFKEIQLVQDWYYNYNENIVYNKIKCLYLCAKKWTVKGEDKKASPILKIVFR